MGCSETVGVAVRNIEKSPVRSRCVEGAVARYASHKSYALRIYAMHKGMLRIRSYAMRTYALHTYALHRKITLRVDMRCIEPQTPKGGEGRGGPARHKDELKKIELENLPSPNCMRSSKSSRLN